jgi:hypothetical protein
MLSGRNEPQPSVPTEVEDATHVWQCQDPRALNVWTQAIANLETWMKQRTEPGIIRVICAKLWPGKADPPRRYKSELLRSSGGGSETGCDRMAILSGRPSVGWSEVQHL